MPPWATRQWSVLRFPQTASLGPLRRIAPFPRPAPVVALRFYAQKPKQHATPAPLHSAIIIPRSTVSLEPNDLIPNIKPVSEQDTTQDCFAVFLLTPSLAHWLNDEHIFLRKALRQLYNHSNPADKFKDLRISALCAVVNKLPIPRALNSINGLDAEISSRSLEPPVSETGYEGLAYASLPASSSMLSPVPYSPERGALNFVMMRQSADNRIFNDVIQLPLANTIFQTERPTTMNISRWDRLAGTNDITLVSKKLASHHSIRIQGLSSYKEYVTTLAIPLVPLTLPRQVDASMGNILRRVIGPDGKSVAASQELEQVVPRYFKSRGEPSQATSVWALITPKNLTNTVYSRTRRLIESDSSQKSVSENEQWDAFWKNDPPKWNRIVPLAIASGARLHRVLSGGGGWGKKAGLLSLDPAAMNEETEVISELDDASRNNEPADLSSALQQVVDQGDSIQFFISSSTTQSESSKECVDLPQLQALSQSPSTQTWQWEIGTIPSTADIIHTGSWQDQPSDSKHPFVFEGSFGALAEGGITISRHHRPQPDQRALVEATMVDVPFSRFSAVSISHPRYDDFRRSFPDVKPSGSLRGLRVSGTKLFEHPAPPLLGLPRRNSLNFAPLPFGRTNKRNGVVRKVRAVSHELDAQHRQEVEQDQEARRRRKEALQAKRKQKGEAILLDNVSSWLGIVNGSEKR